MSTARVVDEVARELRVVSHTSFRMGEEEAPLPARLSSVADRPEVWERAATASLGRLIYEVVYLGRTDRLRQYAAPDERVVPVWERESAPYGRLLRSANRGRGWLSPGWRVVRRVTGARWQVTNGEISLLATARELTSTSGRLRTDLPVSLRFPGHLPYASPGFYVAVGEAGPPAAATPAVRVYVNARVESAPAVLARLTTLMRDPPCPAICKVVNHPSGFGRPDSVVVFLEREAFLSLMPALERTLGRFLPRLNPGIPAFAKPWMPGVALAEQPALDAPGAAVSFGEHRSRLIARGLVRAFLTLARSKPAERDDASLRRKLVGMALSEAGVDAAALYLNPGSEDLYPGGDASTVSGRR